MKTIATTLIACIAIIVFNTQVKAQEINTNCWKSKDYVLMGDRFGRKGLKLVKGVEAYFCFNQGAASFYSKETGLVTFNYEDSYSCIDSTYHNQVMWSGRSYDSQWVIDMTYNNKVLINNTLEAWGIQLQGIYHATAGKRTFKGSADRRKNKKEGPPYVKFN